MLVPSGLPIQIKTKVAWEAIDQVRIIPRRDFYVVEVVYQKAEHQAAVDPKLVAALDLGVNTLAALTSNKPGFIPQLVSGKPIKSLNQYYNKQRAHHHARFLEMLQYKGALVGIQVMTHEESYTSKASFLDLDDIPTYDPKQTEPPTFSGKRIARSWYQAGNGQVIHADVNGSYNIGRKVAPTAFGRGVAGAAVRPRRLAV